MDRIKGKGPSILLVEDEPLIGAMAADWLTDRGFKVRTATSAHEALLHLQSSAPLDALFTDIDLGGEVDGSALARVARQLRPGIPVVYTSGRWKTMDELHPVPGGHFVPKPYDPDSVCELLKRLIAEPVGCTARFTAA
ncbi:MAG TPA: response regulator [Xanthobacteraceae bacterium]|nr:response regulator [Xanthobacteraceae bacterium]